MPTTVLAIAVFGIGLSVSDINFAQTLQPGVPIAPVQPEAPAVAHTADVVPSPAVTESDADQAVSTADATAQSGVSPQDAECLAKIVQHEAANQPERVQLAVAHVVLNRLKSSVFPRSICAIAMQRGQFFNVHAYRPYNDPRWPTSQQIANRAIAGEGLEFAPGALFFHTAGTSSSVSHSHPHVARLGGLDFYR
jgi:spore germination cell wall hydrolase CwlJ-like protein